MTGRRRLVPDAELRRVLDTMRQYGVEIGAVDIRADGVTVYPPSQIPPSRRTDEWADLE